SHERAAGAPATVRMTPARPPAGPCQAGSRPSLVAARRGVAVPFRVVAVFGIKAIHGLVRGEYGRQPRQPVHDPGRPSLLLCPSGTQGSRCVSSQAAREGPVTRTRVPIAPDTVKQRILSSELLVVGHRGGELVGSIMGGATDRSP